MCHLGIVGRPGVFCGVFVCPRVIRLTHIDTHYNFNFMDVFRRVRTAIRRTLYYLNHG